MRRFVFPGRRIGKAWATLAAAWSGRPWSPPARADYEADLAHHLAGLTPCPARIMGRVFWSPADDLGLRVYVGGRLVLVEADPAALCELAERWLVAARFGIAWRRKALGGDEFAIPRAADLRGLARDALNLATRCGTDAPERAGLAHDWTGSA